MDTEKLRLRIVWYIVFISVCASIASTIIALGFFASGFSNHDSSRVVAASQMIQMNWLQLLREAIYFTWVFIPSPLIVLLALGNAIGYHKMRDWSRYWTVWKIAFGLWIFAVLVIWLSLIVAKP